MLDSVSEHLMMQGDRTMIVFIHGMMGTPEPFRPMLSAAAGRGFSVSALLLPGHGGTGRDFARSDRSQWESAVLEHIGHLRTRYSNIILAGHSMGSLLALLAYRFYPDVIRGIIAIATPLCLRIGRQALHRGLRLAPDAADAASGGRRLSLWFSLRCIPRFLDLLGLMRSAESALERVESPVLIIHSARDEVVDMRSAVLLENRLKRRKTLILPQSGHNLYTRDDWDLMVSACMAFSEEPQSIERSAPASLACDGLPRLFA
ncbi:MAG: alpha/beta hydrolase [Christensenellales bacterium]